MIIKAAFDERTSGYNGGENAISNNDSALINWKQILFTERYAIKG